MPLVVPVKFTYASRDLWFDPQDLDILEADYAICSTERGTEIGLVTADPFEVPQDEIGQPLKPVLRVASDIDLQLADDLAIQGDEAMVDFRRLVKELDLEMKPVGVEYLFGGEKAVFYFAAEERVDFRQLVKDLSSTLHIRVDMRQIGVRDETRLVGGYAQCGQELCCTRFGGQFEPVSIRMAKEQDLPLNSSKISGVCGRLMCCLRYEFEAYKDFKSRAPKKKTLIDTPLGKARIQEYDTPREQLVLRLENGKVFKVNLADMTCSEGCKKKAAEQGCSCRPDCVTRDVLERIESPEMRLALMELDRENGVDVGDGLSSADRLAGTSMPKRRRRDARFRCPRCSEPGRGPWPRKGPRQGRGARGRGGGRWPSPPQARGLGRCYRGCNRGQARLSRARGSATPAAESRRWHEPHTSPPPSSVERGARGRLPRRSCSRGRCRFQGRLGLRCACRQERQVTWRGGARAASAPSPFLGRAAEALSALRGRSGLGWRGQGHAPSSRRWRGSGCQGFAWRRSRRARAARGSRWRGLGRPGSKAPSPSPFPQAAPGWWRGLDPVFARTTTARRRITPASGFSPPCPERIGVS